MFKIGDRVRLLDNHHGKSAGFITGEVGTIVKIERGGVVIDGLQHGHDDAYFNISMVAIVKPTILVYRRKQSV